MNSEILENIEDLFLNSQNSIYKARNEIKIIKYGGESLVVKSFKVPHFINKIAYTFLRDSKAKKSYKNAKKIEAFTPRPIGYKELKKFGLFNKSYYVCEKFDYDFTIRELLLDEDFKEREEIFNAFSKFTYDLHEANIEHMDYSPGNILIKKTDNDYIFKVVDVNRMCFKNLNNKDRLENFAKLWATDKDMRMIVKYYIRYIDIDENIAVNIALKASQKHKDKKNFKKRLKGIEVVD